AYRAHDHPEELPMPEDAGPVQLVIEESVHYLPLGNSSEDMWSSLTSAGYGYVRLGPADRTFAVTMFHELHCLRMINRAFTKTEGATPNHLRHCLNYLRQGVLCSPDLAIEPGNFEDRDFEIERTGGTHTCKNWGAVYDTMDSNFLEWKERTGIGTYGASFNADSDALTATLISVDVPNPQ
ncbi:hypothetical protein C8Q78DRAFT_982102, partial [Trametes maxima]